MTKYDLFKFIKAFENRYLTESDKIKIAEYLLGELPKIELDELMNIISEFFNITPAEMVSKKKNKEYVKPRFWFYFIAFKVYNYPLKKIKYAVKRTHGAVINGANFIENALKIYKDDRIIYEKLKLKIKKHSMKNS